MRPALRTRMRRAQLSRIGTHSRSRIFLSSASCWNSQIRSTQRSMMTTQTTCTRISKSTMWKTIRHRNRSLTSISWRCSLCSWLTSSWFCSWRSQCRSYRSSREMESRHLMSCRSCHLRFLLVFCSATCLKWSKKWWIRARLSFALWKPTWRLRVTNRTNPPLKMRSSV